MSSLRRPASSSMRSSMAALSGPERCRARPSIEPISVPTPANAETRMIQSAGDSTRSKPSSAGSGPRKRGVGFAQGHWYNFDGAAGNAEVLIHNDGTIECRSGVQDIGGGIRTALAQVVAEELGLKASDVHVKIGDTAYPGGPASGSGGALWTPGSASGNPPAGDKPKLIIPGR